MPLTLRHQLLYAGRHLARRNYIALARARALRLRENSTDQELAGIQRVLLSKTVDCARAYIPMYSTLPALDAQVDAGDWLRQHCPVVTKADLVARRTDFYPNGGRVKTWWSVGKTSGTSGTPLDVFRSLDSVIWEEAFQLQFWSWAGFMPGMPQAVLRGDQVVEMERQSPPFWLWDAFGRQLLVSTRHVSQTNAPAILDAIEASGARMLRAYPSASYELARLAEGLGRRLHVPAVVTGSEPLFPVQREQLERSFCCKVYDFYGMAERIAFAAQCEHGAYHLNPEYSYVEILDEYDRPTDDFGYVVGTTLRNHVMPLIRYRIADRARWVKGCCPCGRSYPMIELSSGKVEDQLFDADGTPVSASIITFAFKGLANIRKAQVAQVDHGRWEVRVQPDTGFSQHDGNALVQNIADHVTPNVEVILRVVEDIQPLPSGKFKWVSQEWRSARLTSDQGVRGVGEEP